jgi:MFS family permease
MLISIGVGSLTIFSFRLLGLNVLWSVVSETENISGAAVIIGISFVFKALTNLTAGMLVDKFQKKKIIVFSLLCCALFAFIWLTVQQFLITAVFLYLAIDFAANLYGFAFVTLVAEKLSKMEYIKLDALKLITGNITSVISNIIAALFVMWFIQQVVIILGLAILVLSAMICHKYLPNSAVIHKNDEENGSQHVSVSWKTKIDSTWKFAKENVLTNKRILLYIATLFLLNLDYGFIPTLLPFFIMTETEGLSLLLVAIMRSGNDIGEILGANVILKFGHLVSRLTKIGLLGSAAVFTMLPFVYTTPILATAMFILYGFCDILTQPYYSYFVSSLPMDKRGRILGMVDFVVLMSLSLGVLLGTLLSSHGMIPLSIFTVSIFIITAVVISKSKNFGNIRLSPDDTT